jgi:hypothetical protein
MEYRVADNKGARCCMKQPTHRQVTAQLSYPVACLSNLVFNSKLIIHSSRCGCVAVGMRKPHSSLRLYLSDWVRYQTGAAVTVGSRLRHWTVVTICTCCAEVSSSKCHTQFVLGIDSLQYQPAIVSVTSAFNLCIFYMLCFLRGRNVFWKMLLCIDGGITLWSSVLLFRVVWWVRPNLPEEGKR